MSSVNGATFGIGQIDHSKLEFGQWATEFSGQRLQIIDWDGEGMIEVWNPRTGYSHWTSDALLKDVTDEK